MKKLICTFSRCVLIVFLAGSLEAGWALQTHEAHEGLVTHQLAHVFFAGTMALLVYWLESNRFVKNKGWRLVQISCLLLIFWNVVAFSGHWVAKVLDASLIVGESGAIGQRILVQESPLSVCYYVLHMDHLLCVPAMLCLFLGIRSLYRHMGQEKDSME